MADYVRRASEVLGGRFEMVQVAARPPALPGDLPHVRVVVGDPVTSLRLWSELWRSSTPATFTGTCSSDYWQVEVEDLFLTVSTPESEDRPW